MSGSDGPAPDGARCVYLGAGAPGAAERIAMLRQHRLEVAEAEAAGELPDTGARLAILDGSGTPADGLDRQLATLATRDIRILVLFRLGHGVPFRERRRTLRALGAHDVMDADAPAADLLVRARALILGARPPVVLVIEDNEKTGPWVVAQLEGAGLAPIWVRTLAEARQRFETTTVDALVVDRTLPDGDGLHLVALLRDHGIRTPALLFTAMDEVSERISGLRDARADDYICKPVHGDELVARVQVLLRPRDIDEELVFGPLQLGRRDRIVRWRGAAVELRPKEAEMLIYLAEREGLPIPKRMIYADVWDKVFIDLGSNPVTAARHRLVRTFKAFLEARDEAYPEFIATEGDAYLFRAEPLLRLPAGREDA